MCMHSERSVQPQSSFTEFQSQIVRQNVFGLFNRFPKVTREPH